VSGGHDHPGRGAVRPAAHPLAPAAGTFLCELGEVPDGGGHEVAFGAGLDAFRILLLRLGEEVWAYRNLCPHFSLPLHYRPQTFVVCDGDTVMCAHHSSMFRFRDGVCFDGPSAGDRLDPVTLRREGTRIFFQGEGRP